jgi:hypothetical protein
MSNGETGCITHSINSHLPPQLWPYLEMLVVLSSVSFERDLCAVHRMSDGASKILVLDKTRCRPR